MLLPCEVIPPPAQLGSEGALPPATIVFLALTVPVPGRAQVRVVPRFPPQADSAPPLPTVLPAIVVLSRLVGGGLDVGVPPPAPPIAPCPPAEVPVTVTFGRLASAKFMMPPPSPRAVASSPPAGFPLT